MRLFGEKSQPDERDQFQVRKPRTVTLPGPVEQIPRQLSAHVCLSENTDGTFCRRTWAQELGSRWGPQMPIPTRDLCCHLSETCSSFPSHIFGASASVPGSLRTTPIFAWSPSFRPNRPHCWPISCHLSQDCPQVFSGEGTGNQAFPFCVLAAPRTVLYTLR